VPVGPEDGCMHVVPASHDELLEASEDPRHLRVMSPSPSGTALSCQAGEVCFAGSTVDTCGYSGYMTTVVFV